MVSLLYNNSVFQENRLQLSTGFFHPVFKRERVPCLYPSSQVHTPEISYAGVTPSGKDVSGGKGCLARWDPARYIPAVSLKDSDFKEYRIRFSYLDHSPCVGFYRVVDDVEQEVESISTLGNVSLIELAT